MDQAVHLLRSAAVYRLRYASLAAAARATLAADHDGEADPLWYLRDELAHPTPPELPADRWRR